MKVSTGKKMISIALGFAALSMLSFGVMGGWGSPLQDGKKKGPRSGESQGQEVKPRISRGARQPKDTRSLGLQDLLKVTEAIAIINPTEGNSCKGWVKIEKMGSSVRITAEISGLEPNTQHGFHIHRFGDCSSPDGKSAGGHYNPQKEEHALPPEPHRHAGDLGNLLADSNGVAHYERTVKMLSIIGRVNPILGRSFVIHADPDDGSQPTGNSGDRIGCGVIGIANPSE